MKALLRIVVVISIVFAFCDPALAAKKKNNKKKKSGPPEAPAEQVDNNPNTDNLKYVTISTGAQIACYASDGTTYIPGTTEDRNGSTVFIHSDPVDDYQNKLLAYQIGQVNKKKKKALSSVNKKIKKAKAISDAKQRKKQLSKLKKQKKKKSTSYEGQVADLQSQIDTNIGLTAEKLAVCNGADPETPDSLTPFVGTVSESMAERFMKVFGFGSGGQDAYIKDVILTQGPAAGLSELKRARAETATLITDVNNPGNVLTLPVYFEDMKDGEIDIGSGGHFTENMGEESWNERGVRDALYMDMFWTNNSLQRKRGMFMFHLWPISWECVSNNDTASRFFQYILDLYAAAPDLDLQALAKAHIKEVMLLLCNDAEGNTASSGVNHAYARALAERILPNRVGRDESNPATYGVPIPANEDISALMSIASGWSVAELPDANNNIIYFAINIGSEHLSGGPFNVNGLSADTLDDYISGIFALGDANNPSDLALYYAREILKDTLMSDPTVPLIKDTAAKIYDHNWNLGLVMDEVALSAVFFSPNTAHTIPMYPYEAFVSLLRTLKVPFPEVGNDGIREQIDKTSYSITRAPIPDGYSRSEFNVNDMNRVREGIEDLFNNEGNYFNPLLANYNTTFNFTPAYYVGAPDVFEMLSADLTKFVAALLGIDPDSISADALAAYSNYVLTYPELNMGMGGKQPYNGASETISERKAAGLVPVLLGLYLFM